jgi:hypothetical protein
VHARVRDLADARGGKRAHGRARLRYQESGIRDQL